MGDHLPSFSILDDDDDDYDDDDDDDDDDRWWWWRQWWWWWCVIMSMMMITIMVSCVFIPRRPLMRYLLWYRVVRIYPLWTQHRRRWAHLLSVLLLVKFVQGPKHCCMVERMHRLTKTPLHGREKVKIGAVFINLCRFQHIRVYAKTKKKKTLEELEIEFVK